jgi:signal transduction histidine kinase
MNLLVNASQAVGDRGTVQVATTALDSSVVVTISDDGCGIAPEDLPRIFDPFFTTKPVGDGTGLGLSVIYSIIERHHGSIDVQSKIGEGTTFTVTIPIDAEPDGAQPSVGNTRDEHLVYSY